MQAEAKAARKQLTEADARLQQYEARDLLNSIEPRGDFGLITQTWLNRDAAYLKRMASLLVAQPKTVALLGATGPVVVAGLCALQRSVDRSGGAVESRGGAAGRQGRRLAGFCAGRRPGRE